MLLLYSEFRPTLKIKSDSYRCFFELFLISGSASIEAPWQIRLAKISIDMSPDVRIEETASIP